MRKVVYLVAARHVVKSRNRIGPLHVRVNHVGGGYSDIETNRDDWDYHGGTDVAVLPLKREPHFELDGLSPELLITADSQTKVEVGDHTFSIGLFVPTPGIHRSEPIPRFGRVSRMPDPNEPVEIRLEDKQSKFYVEAYLVEGQSWRGASGSPVFVYRPEGHLRGSEWSHELRGPWLIGLTHGSSQMPLGIKADPQERLRGVTLYANSGMVAVIPTEKIIETLERPAVKAKREKLLREAEGE